MAGIPTVRLHPNFAQRLFQAIIHSFKKTLAV